MKRLAFFPPLTGSQEPGSTLLFLLRLRLIDRIILGLARILVGLAVSLQRLTERSDWFDKSSILMVHVIVDWSCRPRSIATGRLITERGSWRGPWNSRCLNRCWVWDADAFRRGGGIVSVAYRFGEEARNRRKVGNETRCFVAGPTLQARSLAEKSYARGGWSEYKGGPCVILHRSEQCAVKHGRAARFPCPAPTHAARNFARNRENHGF